MFLFIYTMLILKSHTPLPPLFSTLLGKVLEGSSAFAIWKSLYFSKLMSSKNQAQVAFDWIQTSVFGRDISTPNSMETPCSPASLVKEKNK